MKANQDKCHFLSSLDTTTGLLLPDCSVENSSSEKLPEVIVERKLKFEEQVTNLCNKSKEKIQAQSRVFMCMPEFLCQSLCVCQSSYVYFRVFMCMPVTQRKLLMNAHFLSQFEYCPLVWVNHSRILNNRISRLHERALRLVHSDFNEPFPELLIKDESVTINQ